MIMNIGIDLHDTITYKPDHFRKLISAARNAGHKVIIISGTPEKDRAYVVDSLKKMKIEYDGIALGFDYEKENMDSFHFRKMQIWKYKICKEYEIDIYIDDNPYYVRFLSSMGILCLQTILDPKYIKEWAEKDPYFTCNLQAEQFEFLKKTILQRK